MISGRLNVSIKDRQQLHRHLCHRRWTEKELSNSLNVHELVKQSGLDQCAL